MRPVVTFTALIVVANLWAQEREDRPILGLDRMRAIINEVSGDRPLQTLKDMIPWQRIRTDLELEKGPYRETAVMAQAAREAGFADVKVVSEPGQGQVWTPLKGELWIEGPAPVKLLDVNDVALALCTRSADGDVKGELVDVGVGDRPEHYEGKDLKGKVVLGSAWAGQLQRMALERGAIGILSYNSSHADLDPTQIGSQGFSRRGDKAGFGWSLPTTLGQELARRLARGERITIRSVVQGKTYPSRSERVEARIPGDGSSSQALVVSGHLYEGITKQGANDDGSGCVVSLEMGRALIRLQKEGALPRLKRDIHFIWVPEIEGSMAWLKANPQMEKRLIANLNFDMEGIGLAENRTQWVLHRTPDTRPSFLNDVCENAMQFLADVNRDDATRHGIALPTVSPTGSRDPFYIYISKFSGGSDHEVFLERGIPAVMSITWPDPYYHTSHDLPEKQDTTQLKRVGVTGVATMTAIAAADDTLALRIASECLGRGASRIGQAHRKGLAYLADLKDGAQFPQVYRDAKNAVRHQVEVEKAVLTSAGQLMSKEMQAGLATMAKNFDRRAEALQAETAAFARLTADRLKVRFAEPLPSDLEKRASRFYPVHKEGGEGGFRNRPRIPWELLEEVSNLVAAGKSVLEIRDFLSGEFDPLPLEDVVAHFEDQQRQGSITLVDKSKGK